MVDNEVQRYKESLKNPEVDVRRAAARALGEIGPGAREAVPDLVEALNDEEMDLIAIWALGRIGPAAIAAAPAIRRWIEKVNSYCRSVVHIRGQLAHLPEDERRRFKTEMPYDESQVQASRHR